MFKFLKASSWLLAATIVSFGAQRLMAEPVPKPAENTLPERPLIVCLGDSITARGYPQVLEKLLKVRVVNVGINGNTSRQGVARLEKDVLSKKPDVVVFFFGTNDSRRDAPKHQVALEEYRTNILQIIERCQGVGAKVLVGVMPPITPEPYFTRHPKNSYDDVGGFEPYIEKYREAAREAARKKNARLIDLNALLKKSPNWVSEDGVHPTPEGNEILAHLIAEEVKPLLEK